MNLTSCIAALGLCLLPLCSQAGIIYEWRSLNNETPRDISLALEFDEATVRSGAFSFAISQDYDFSEDQPAGGLLGLRYSFPDAYEPMSYSAQGGFGSRFGMIEMDLRFEQGGFLSGYIYANDSHHHVEMLSTGPVFTIFGADSDEGMPSSGCGWTVGIDCSGATGRIRSTDIPEPGSLALLGAGLLAAAALRRKAAR